MENMRAVSLEPVERDIKAFSIMLDGVEIGAAITGPMLFPAWECKLWGYEGPSKRPVEFIGRGDTNGNAIIDAIQRAERASNERKICIACLKADLMKAGISIE